MSFGDSSCLAPILISNALEIEMPHAIPSVECVSGFTLLDFKAKLQIADGQVVSLPQLRTEADMLKAIREAGRTPVQRNTFHDSLESGVASALRHCTPNAAATVNAQPFYRPNYRTRLRRRQFFDQPFALRRRLESANLRAR